MTTKEKKEIMEQTVKMFVRELKKEDLLKNNKQTPFQKTETLLYNYNNFKRVIEDKLLQIETIRHEGVPKKSASISTYSSQSIFDNSTDEEKAEELIRKIQESIQVTDSLVNTIDLALKDLENEEYYEIIKLKYFEGKKRDKIAEYFDCDVRTVTRNKNKLINSIQIKLFSDEYILQMIK